MFNKVIMMGRLVTDPELRTTPQGVNVCSFRIAVDRHGVSRRISCTVTSPRAGLSWSKVR